MPTVRIIPNWPGYKVTANGKVWSEKTGKWMTKTIGNHGYYVVNLTKKGKQSVRCVHALVMEAFVGPRPAGMEIRHLNGDRLDCRLSNLRYGTSKENYEDSVMHGTFKHLRQQKGNLHPMSKLTEKKVLQIKYLLKTRMPQAAIAKKYNVTPQAIHCIKKGKAWSWLKQGDK